jgi:hypothetical protein
MRIKSAATVRVVYPSGQHAFDVAPDEARRMIHAGVGEGVGSKRQLHLVRLFDGPPRPHSGTRYSHDRATDTNPHGVFTLRSIVDLPRDLFRAVESSVLA